MKNTLPISALLLLLFFLIAACERKQVDPANPNKLGETILNPKTSIISEKDYPKVLSYDTVANMLELAADINISLLEKDAIIVSGPTEKAPNGFLVKVIEVVQKDGTIKLKTIPVYLDEAFDQLDFSTEFTLSEIKRKGNKGDTSDISSLSINQEFELVPPGIATLAFKATTEPKFKHEIKIGLSGIEKISLTLLTDISSSATLTSSIETGELKLTKNLLDKRLKNILFFIPTAVGPFPVLIGSYVTCDAQASGKLGAGYGVSYAGTAATSNTVSYGNTWSNKNTIRFNDAKFTNSKLQGKANFGVSAIPGFRLRFYNSDAASARLNFPLKLSFDYNGLMNPDKELNLSINAVAKFDFANIINYNTPLSFEYKKLIWEDKFVVKKLEGDQKVFTKGIPVDTLLTVLVTDANKNPRAGVKVKFKPEGGNSFTATTDAAGIAKWAYVPSDKDKIKIYYELAEIKNPDGTMPTGNPEFFQLEKGPCKPNDPDIIEKLTGGGSKKWKIWEVDGDLWSKVGWTCPQGDSYYLYSKDLTGYSYIYKSQISCTTPPEKVEFKYSLCGNTVTVIENHISFINRYTFEIISISDEKMVIRSILKAASGDIVRIFTYVPL